MLLMIDNYDSFTYNLVQYFGELGAEVQVYRNDQVTIAEMENCHPDHIVISPGPCTPNEAGISLEAIKHFALGGNSVGQYTSQAHESLSKGVIWWDKRKRAARMNRPTMLGLPSGAD